MSIDRFKDLPIKNLSATWDTGLLSQRLELVAVRVEFDARKMCLLSRGKIIATRLDTCIVTGSIRGLDIHASWITHDSPPELLGVKLALLAKICDGDVEDAKLSLEGRISSATISYDSEKPSVQIVVRCTPSSYERLAALLARVQGLDRGPSKSGSAIQDFISKTAFAAMRRRVMGSLS
jgi:hypothetical protein